jgi:hypothetical protein
MYAILGVEATRQRLAQGGKTKANRVRSLGKIRPELKKGGPKARDALLGPVFHVPFPNSVAEAMLLVSNNLSVQFSSVQFSSRRYARKCAGKWKMFTNMRRVAHPGFFG